MEDEEVLELLNDNLKLELIATLNGKALRSEVFNSFNVAFLSEVTFVLQRETFSMDDLIFRVINYHSINIIILGGL
jgi:hypothetical protein